MFLVMYVRHLNGRGMFFVMRWRDRCSGVGTGRGWMTGSECRRW